MYLFKKSKMNNLTAGNGRTFLLGCLVFAVLAAGNYADAQAVPQSAGNVNGHVGTITPYSSAGELTNTGTGKTFSFAGTTGYVSGTTNASLHYDITTGTYSYVVNDAVNNETLSKNTLTVNTGSRVSYVYAGLGVANGASAIQVNENTLNIQGQVGNTAAGGMVINLAGTLAQANHNILHITGTGSVGGSVFGGSILSGSGTADDNTVSISTVGTVGVTAGSVIIGGKAGQTARDTASGNGVTITTGTIGSSLIVGGDADGEEAAGTHGGTAEENWVTINGGTFANTNVIGGAGNKTHSNKVNLNAGTFNNIFGSRSLNAESGGYGTNNEVNVFNATINGNVRGASLNYTDSGSAVIVAEENVVTVTGGMINGSVVGGYVASNGQYNPYPNHVLDASGKIVYTLNMNAQAYKNQVNVSGGTISGSVIGGEAGPGGGTVTENTVTIKGDALVGNGGDVIGGRADQGGTAADNYVIIGEEGVSDGRLTINSQNIHGGSVNGDGKAYHNTVTINGGIIRLADSTTSGIVGGYSNGDGDSNSNYVIINGGEYGNIFAINGGFVKEGNGTTTGNAKDNYVIINKDVTGLENTLIAGGYADTIFTSGDYGDIFTGNTLAINDNITVGAVAFFETIAIAEGKTLNVTGEVNNADAQGYIDNIFGGGLVGGTPTYGEEKATEIRVLGSNASITGKLGGLDPDFTSFTKTGNGTLTLNSVQGGVYATPTWSIPTGAVITVKEGVLEVPVKSTFIGLTVEGSAKVVITGVTNDMITSAEPLLRVAIADAGTHGAYASEGKVQTENELYFLGFQAEAFGIYNGGYYYGKRHNAAMMSDNFLSAARIHSAYTMWNGTRDHLISGNTRWIPVTPKPFKLELPKKLPRLKIVRGQVDQNAGLFGNPLERSAWVNYVGRSDSFDNSYSNTADWKVKMDGWQAGFDLFRTSRNQLGLLLGFEKGDTISEENRIETDDHYIGLYAAHILNNGMDIRLLFNYGWQEFDSQRYNTLGTTGWNAASLTGTSSEFTLEFGKRLVQDSGFSMRPVLAFDFYETKMDKGGEYAGVSPVSYDASSYKQTFFRTGGDFQLARENLLLNCGLFWSTDLLTERLSTRVTQLGVTNILRGGSPSGSLVTFNLNGSYTFKKMPLTVFGGYTIHGCMDGDGNAQNIGHAGGAWRW